MHTDLHTDRLQWWWPPLKNNVNKNVNVNGVVNNVVVDPIYMNWQVNVIIHQPKRNQKYKEGVNTVHVEWSIEMGSIEVNELWTNRKHGQQICMEIHSINNNNNNNNNNKTDLVTSNNCIFEQYPKFNYLTSGNYTLSIYLIDQNNNTDSNQNIILTSTTTVPFEILPIWSMQKIALPTNANVMIGNALTAEWPIDYQLRKKLTEKTYGHSLANIVMAPDYNSEWYV